MITLNKIFNKSKNTEVLDLAEEILKNIELDELPLSDIVLRCARLARLTGNQDAINLFSYELKGYPTDNNGYVLPDAFNLARYTNRIFKQKDPSNVLKEFIFSETVAELISEVDCAKDQLKVSSDPNISIASSNPNQYIPNPMGNSFERNNLRSVITEKTKKIYKLKIAYQEYVLGVINEMKLSNLSEDIFQRRKLLVDKSLSKTLPKTLEKFVSIYENLDSDNCEDWANAVHSCRRILKDVADLLHPPSEKEITLPVGKKIKLDDENYIIRLKQYIKEKSTSNNFYSIVGSNLDYIGDRIDALYKASTKGSHSNVTKEEAERYVIYTYLLLSDLLTL